MIWNNRRLPETREDDMKPWNHWRWPETIEDYLKTWRMTWNRERWPDTIEDCLKTEKMTWKKGRWPETVKDYLKPGRIKTIIWKQSLIQAASEQYFVFNIFCTPFHPPYVGHKLWWVAFHKMTWWVVWDIGNIWDILSISKTNLVFYQK